MNSFIWCKKIKQPQKYGSLNHVTCQTQYNAHLQILNDKQSLEISNQALGFLLPVDKYSSLPEVVTERCLWQLCSKFLAEIYFLVQFCAGGNSEKHEGIKHPDSKSLASGIQNVARWIHWTISICLSIPETKNEHQVKP